MTEPKEPTNLDDAVNNLVLVVERVQRLAASGALPTEAQAASIVVAIETLAKLLDALAETRDVMSAELKAHLR